LARQVAEALTAKDAFAAHARDASTSLTLMQPLS
jgi:hypothetical protein